MEFEDKPDYDKLRFQLVKTLLDINETPTTEYDWNVGIPQKVSVPKVKPQNAVMQDANDVGGEVPEEDALP